MMGYTTRFNGEFNLEFNDETKREDVITLVNGLAGTRRMSRDMTKIKDILPKEPEAYGIEGEFFFPSKELGGFMGQNHDESVINSNRTPSTQPSLWLQWIIEDNEVGSYVLKWDEGEKFYEYVEWLEYLIESIFIPADVSVDGEVDWFGEDTDDNGTIFVKNNIVSTRTKSLQYD